MNSRRRYDTTALIQDLKTDRRKGIGLTIAAVVILLLLIGVYVSQMGGDTPEVPGDAAPSAASPEERAKALKNAISDGDEEEPTEAAEADSEPKEEKKAKPVPVTVQVLLPRKTELFVNDESVGKVKSYDVELDAGAHVFKAKFGKKMITHEETLNAGAKVQVIFQPKKRKAVTKVLEGGEEAEAPEG